ncbi:conserved exported protein of unknown function [Burkholderia multivorans]
MNRMRGRACCAVLAYGLLLTGAALAQESPAPVTRGGVTYLTGGIGSDEAQTMRAAAPHYNLRLLFTTTRGAYLSDADVAIQALAGTAALDARAEGPYFYAKVPPGRYRVGVRLDGAWQSRLVTVPARGGVALGFHGGASRDPTAASPCERCGPAHATP